MARRPDEIAFSSDSFLDVVANLVGILIILIVLAGVKVARAPVIAANVLVTSEVPEPVFETPPLPAPVLTEEPLLAAIPEPEPVATVVEEPPLLFPPLPAVKVDPRWRDEEARLQADIDRFQKAEAQSRGEFQKLQQMRQSSEKELATSQQAIEARQQQLQQEKQQLESVQTEVRGLQERVSQAQLTLGRIVNEPPPVQTLEHELTPVGRLVTGKEVHFRLVGNRVAYVPMEELVDQVKVDIERKKDTMLTRPMYQGSVGPIHGFKMDYILQRDSLSLAEELKLGRGMIRMSVTGWILQPQSDLPTESAEEALDANSEFQRALRSAGPSSTLTFWVYSDSFEVHRQLKQFAHETGFWVASRPLPQGVPISGSPQGARSLAQ